MSGEGKPGLPTEQELATGVSELSPEGQEAALGQFGRWKARERAASRLTEDAEDEGPPRADGSEVTRHIRHFLKTAAG
jgi:hypothetical protein